MEIEKNKFKRALELVKPALSSAEAIENTTSFGFSKNKVTAYNDEICISHVIDGLDLSGLVIADELYSFINKMNGLTLKMEVDEKQLILKSGRMKAGFVLKADESLPLDELHRQKKWHDIPNQFLESLRLAAKSVSKDNNKPILTCVHVNKQGFIEGSDNLRIMRCTMNEEFPFSSFLIPSKSVQEVLKLKPNKIALTKGWVHFKNEENTDISCRLFLDNYPDTNAFLHVKGKKLTFPKSIIKILEKASIFKRGDSELTTEATFLIKDGFMLIKSESNVGNWYKQKEKIDYSGTPFSFMVTPILLHDIVSLQRTCTIGSKLIKFEGDGWIYINALRYKTD